MQATIQLTLKTREVSKLFQRKINNNRLFINAILHKFSIITKNYKQQVPGALATHHQTEQAILTLKKQFMEENHKFDNLLSKHPSLKNKQLNIISQFSHTITITTSLSLHLVEFIEIYDKLIAIFKLLHLAGSFASHNDYYSNIKRIQILANKMLSQIIHIQQV